MVGNDRDGRNLIVQRPTASVIIQKTLQKVEKRAEPLSRLSYSSESIVYWLDSTFPQQSLIISEPFSI